ncbi:hypothetical protein GCM10009828_086280 [Actinoplanes couchii]|uniref:Uncharacterized protein n=1 Tax=Actinoplanes couchii TaxID=403638 RepID=A0ABQ3XET0_9ACTN|nr:hypothetical protein Aco03nite_054060 [Actinoplanes couchii]
MAFIDLGRRSGSDLSCCPVCLTGGSGYLPNGADLRASLLDASYRADVAYRDWANSPDGSCTHEAAWSSLSRCGTRSAGGTAGAAGGWSVS